jgi:hypothetical protein
MDFGESCRMELRLNQYAGYMEPGYFMQIASWFA